MRKGTKRKQQKNEGESDNENHDKKQNEGEGIESGTANGALNQDNEIDSSEPKPPSSKKSKSKKKGGNKSKNANEEKDTEDSGDVDYEVEKIIKWRTRNGINQYLVRWKGFTSKNDTWEPEDNLSCAELLEEFKKTSAANDGGKKKKGKGKKGGKSKGEEQPPENDDDEEKADAKEYEVEKILEVHHKKNGKRIFLVRWKGFSKKDDSWEPEENLNCSDLINAFQKRVEKAKESTQRETRIKRKKTDRFVLQSPDSGRKLSARIRRGGARRTYYEDDD